METKITWNGKKITEAASRAGERALYEGAEKILAASKSVVPHATGTLERSGTVSPGGPANEVYISYNTPYARRQHEELNWRHPDPTNPISSSGRSAKYLETPFNQMKDRVLSDVANAIKAAIGR